MYYNKIINPITGKQVNINSRLGKKILSRYLSNKKYLGGSAITHQEFKPGNCNDLRWKKEIKTLKENVLPGTEIEISNTSKTNILAGYSKNHPVTNLLMDIDDKVILTTIVLTSKTGNEHKFYLYPEFPFKMPIHFINGILDASLTGPTDIMNRYKYKTYQDYPLHPEGPAWSPVISLNRFFYENLTMKKLSEIDEEILKNADTIVINIGYCNYMNITADLDDLISFPTRFISHKLLSILDNEKTLHILIDPRDQPLYIVKDMAKYKIKGKVIHSKIFPVPTVQGVLTEDIEGMYQVFYNNTDMEADMQWFINILKKYSSKINILDTMFFLGTWEATCPQWFIDALRTNPPQSYNGYAHLKSAHGTLSLIDKCSMESLTSIYKDPETYWDLLDFSNRKPSKDKS